MIKKMQKSLVAHKAIFKKNPNLDTCYSWLNRIYDDYDDVSPYVTQEAIHDMLCDMQQYNNRNRKAQAMTMNKPLFEAVALTGTAWLKAERE